MFIRIESQSQLYCQICSEHRDVCEQYRQYNSNEIYEGDASGQDARKSVSIEKSSKGHSRLFLFSVCAKSRVAVGLFWPVMRF